MESPPQKLAGVGQLYPSLLVHCPLWSIQVAMLTYEQTCLFCIFRLPFSLEVLCTISLKPYQYIPQRLAARSCRLSPIMSTTALSDAQKLADAKALARSFKTWVNSNLAKNKNEPSRQARKTGMWS